MALKTVGSSPITHPIQTNCLPRCHKPGKAQHNLHKFARVPEYIGMSPSGKAPDFDSGIRRFESCHPSHVRRRLLHSASAVSVSAAKAPYPQPPSSFSPRDPLCWARAGAPREAKNDPLAQSVEQLPFKQWVWGSNPQRVTTTSEIPPHGSEKAVA